MADAQQVANAPTTSSTPSTIPWRAAPVDRQAAHAMRLWLMGEERDVVSPPARTAPAGSGAPDVSLPDWCEYIQSAAIQEIPLREAALRDLYRRTDSVLLRGAILRAIKLDPAFKSRQAMFMRRYGFYANWFNRVLYSTGQAVQGNVQSALQLGADAVTDSFRPRGADPLARKAFDLTRRAQALRRQPVRDEKKLRKLEQAVDRTLAQSDLERARWAMDQADFDAAAFYARQAALRLPDWKKALRIERQALDEAAAARRHAMASGQVGYPDRTPPVDPSRPELLRAILLGGEALENADLHPNEALVAETLKELPPPGRGRATMMQTWPKRIARATDAPFDQRRWLRAMSDSDAQNPDARLDRARWRRRGQIWKYIFWGPDPTPERLHRTTGWFVKSWQALRNVGLFYLAEVVSRTGQAMLSPPTPPEELLDAQAAWLREASDPITPDARRIALDLAEQYGAMGRYASARDLLQQFDAADAKRLKKLNRAEARQALRIAEMTPPGRQRDRLTARAFALAPQVAQKERAKRPPTPENNREPILLRVDWDTLQQWTGQPLPCGLPGHTAWFDGEIDNGEISRAGLEIEPIVAKDEVTVRYPVLYGERILIHEETMGIESMLPAMRRWIEMVVGQRTDAAATVERLDRLPIPFRIEGGVGPSGLDLAPKLLPLDPPAEEDGLYR